MKEFNLEEAINGKAFYLKNGYRGVIKYCVDDILTSEDRTPRFAYIGYVLDNRGFLNLSKAAWDENGITNEPRSYDAVGMVEDMLEQNAEEKMKMKPFDLKAALNGEPVNANGQKCYVVREVTELLDDKSLRRFVVIFPDSFTDAEIWDEHDLIDDIEMWEEPKISIEDLPKPFKPINGDSYYYICGRAIEHMRKYAEKIGRAHV